MTDTLTPEQRSRHMARIGSGLRKNALERRVHGILKGARIPHRMYPTVVPSFDVELRTALGPVYLAVDGCFWHACPLHYRRPKTRRAFWRRHVELAEDRRRAARLAFDRPWAVVMEHDVGDPVNGRDLVLGIARAAIERVKSGGSLRGDLTIDEVLAASAGGAP
jgi:DNA mismatch endonuclease, patch repair protein